MSIKEELQEHVRDINYHRIVTAVDLHIVKEDGTSVSLTYRYIDDYVKFLDRFECECLIGSGIVWFSDGSWSEYQDDHWEHFKRPLIPKRR